MPERRGVDAQDPGGQAPVLECRRWRRVTRPSGPGQSARAAAMTRKRRNTLMVCRPCRDAIHAIPVTRGVIRGELSALKAHAEFAGRLRGKGRASHSVNPDLAAQPILSTSTSRRSCPARTPAWASSSGHSTAPRRRPTGQDSYAHPTNLSPSRTACPACTPRRIAAAAGRRRLASVCRAGRLPTGLPVAGAPEWRIAGCHSFGWCLVFRGSHRAEGKANCGRCSPSTPPVVACTWR